MEKLKIYLETTVFNFYYAPDASGYRELKGQVHRVFDLIKTGQFEPYTSALAMGEIESDQNEEHRKQMEILLPKYEIRA
jgi:hypothetical protein